MLFWEVHLMGGALPWTSSGVVRRAPSGLTGTASILSQCHGPRGAARAPFRPNSALPEARWALSCGAVGASMVASGPTPISLVLSL